MIMPFQEILDNKIEHLLRVTLDCLQPLYRPTYLDYELHKTQDDFYALHLSDERWGTIGHIQFMPQHANRTGLRFQEPTYPTQGEADTYKPAIRQYISDWPAAISLGEYYDNHQDVSNWLRFTLHEQRLLCLTRTHDWLLERLRIYGRPVYLPGDGAVADTKIGAILGVEIYREQLAMVSFELAIQARPAEFIGFARRLEDSRSRDSLQAKRIKLKVYHPGTRKVMRKLHPGLAAALLQLERNQGGLQIYAQSIPESKALLTTSFEERRQNWDFWILILDELERMGLFRLQEIPAIHPMIENQPEQAGTPPSVQEDKPRLAPWEEIPNLGYDRELVRLWHTGLQAGEIGRRLEISEKTVYNRLSELRQQHGQGKIPRRRTIRDKPGYAGN